MSTILRSLVQRRSSRNGAAYVPWAFTYVLIGFMLWHGKADRSPDEVLSLWPGIIPLCIIGVQCLRPTVLGWLFVFVFALACNGFFVYVEFLAYRVRDQSEGGWQGTSLLLLFVALFIVAPVALLVAAWPKALSGSPPPNHALQRTEAGG